MTRSLFAILLAGASLAYAAGPWDDIQFLFGKWGGGGQGQPGAGQGEFSFEPDLNGRIVVRHSFNQIASGREAGTRHDDLLILYSEPPNDAKRAIYFDSEGHVIRYNVTVPHPKNVVFESDVSQPGPRYRLSYSLDGDVLNGQFEIAESAKAQYKTYLNWKAKKL